jgi:hypothetical protein
MLGLFLGGKQHLRPCIAYKAGWCPGKAFELDAGAEMTTYGVGDGFSGGLYRVAANEGPGNGK